MSLPQSNQPKPALKSALPGAMLFFGGVLTLVAGDDDLVDLLLVEYLDGVDRITYIGGILELHRLHQTLGLQQ